MGTIFTTASTITSAASDLCSDHPSTQSSHPNIHAMAPRIRIFSIIGTLLLGLYGAVYFNLIEQDYVTQQQVELIPAWAIAFVGTLCVLDIAKGVFNLDGAEEAAAELMRDVQDAKKDLASKGLKVEYG